MFIRWINRPRVTHDPAEERRFHSLTKTSDLIFERFPQLLEAIYLELVVVSKNTTQALRENTFGMRKCPLVL